jgi:translation initiation factor RLI1
MSFAVEIASGVTISCISCRNYENCSICLKKCVYKVLDSVDAKEEIGEKCKKKKKFGFVYLFALTVYFAS